MPSSTPDWSALASKHEKLVDRVADEGRSPAQPDETDESAAARLASGRGRHRSGTRPDAGPRWRIRGSHAAAAGTAIALAVTGAGAAVAATAIQPTGPTWHLVKQFHDGGIPGEFTAVTSVGTSGGWAFAGPGFGPAPVAFRRSGATWTRARFPGHSGEGVVAVKATSPTNVWAFTTTGTSSRALRWNGHTWTAKHSFGRAIGGAVVLSSTNVWVFGESIVPGNNLGAWHYNGHSWTKIASGGGLQGGSALSASSIWAFDAESVAHWNGHTWTRTSVKSLLPPRVQLNDPAVQAIYAQSATSVYAVGNGNREDEGGPVVILHYNGHAWSKVATASAGADIQNVPQVIAPDGHGGLWIPLSPSDGSRTARLLHYSGGHVTTAALPVANDKILIQNVAHIPGTGQALAVGYTHSTASLGNNIVGVILQFK